MTELRQNWEGVSLPGDFILEKWLGGDENGFFFQTKLSPTNRTAVVKLVRNPAGDSSSLLDLCHKIRPIRHPNLIELLDCGRADLAGDVVLYAVFEAPDDPLASALSQSPLSAREAREVLDSVIEALRCLHTNHLVLGALDPHH